MPAFRPDALSVLSVCTVAGALFFGASAAMAQDFPDHTIKMVVPLSAGGTADTLGRMMAAGMQESLKQSVVVENRAGGGTTIGAAAVARATPDGYTLLLGSGSTHTVAPVVIKKMLYDPQRDFAPIALVGASSYVLVVNPKLPITSLQALVEMGRTNPQKLSYGSTGVGGAVHLATVMLEQLSGARFLHVPYKGGAPAIADLLGGQINFTLTTAESAQMITSGKLRALAVLGPKRLASIPDVPTCIEAGIPACDFPVWNAVFAPAGTPEPVLERLRSAANETIAKPENQARLREMGYEPGSGNTAALVERVVNEGKFMQRLATSAGIDPQ